MVYDIYNLTHDILPIKSKHLLIMQNVVRYLNQS